MARQVILEFPGELPQEILRDPEVMEKGKQAIVLELLRQGAISQGRATELLEMDRNTLFDLMAEHHIPVVEMTADELKAELSMPFVDSTTATAGAWKSLLDCQVFERDVYESRRPPKPTA